MTNKITNVTALDYVLANCDLPTEYAEKIKTMQATFARKNKASGGERKPTATQIANAKIKEQILESMDLNTEYTASDVCKLIEIESNQKVSALLKQLVDTGELNKRIEKRKSYFSLAKMSDF